MPDRSRRDRHLAHGLEYLKDASDDANPELFRLVLKLASGAGKTTVMAMLIAWQTVNAVRRPAGSKFTCGFLIAPRPDNQGPPPCPAARLRERIEISQGGRALLKGRRGEDLNTLEKWWEQRIARQKPKRYRSVARYAIASHKRRYANGGVTESNCGV